VIESIFKKHFWVVQGLFIALAALLLAAGANGFVAARLMPFTVAIPEAGAATASDDEAVEEVGSRQLPPALFGEEEEEAAPDLCATVSCAENEICNPGTGACEPAQPAEETGPAVADGRCLESDIAVNLVGTQVSSIDAFSIAVLHNPALNRTQFARIGDTILAEAEVTAVERGRILITRNGREECLRFGDQTERSARRNEQVGVGSGPTGAGPTVSPVITGAPTVASPTAAPATGGAIEDRIREGITRNDDGTYQVQRSLIQEVANNQALLEQQAPRVVPNYRDGQPNGFRLQGLRSDSMFSRIGLRNGDVIMSVDGTTIDTPQRALELYDAMLQRNQVSVTVLRRGRETTLSYNIQ
jgi:general secretion pathway protein C